MIFVLAILAAYRVSYAIAIERGPFSLFDGLRTAVANRLGYDHWLAIGSGCIKCISFWLAGLLMVMLQPNTAVEAVVWWGGIAGGAFVLHHVVLLIQFIIARG